MVTYIQGQQADVENLVTRGPQMGISPLMAVSVGTAGAYRLWRFLERMADAGRLDRVQSAIVYDYNQMTLDKIRQRARKLRRTHGTSIHLPQKVRSQDGFLLNPYGFGEYLGVIDSDMDDLILQVQRRSRQIGSSPQLIIEFLGFGGHSIIGLILHNKIRKAFPDAHCLPVICLPRDPALEDWMRRPPAVNNPEDEQLESWVKKEEEIADKQHLGIHPWMRHGTWQAYEAMLKLKSGDDALVIDNEIDSAPNDRLAIGLANMEAAGMNSLKGGSLPEAIGGLRNYAHGWLGMNFIRKPVPARKVWTPWPPFRRLKPVWTKDDELPVRVTAAIIESLDSGGLLSMKGEEDSFGLEQSYSALEQSSNGHQLGQHIGTSSGNGTSNGHQAKGNQTGLQDPPEPNQVQRIFVTVPIPKNWIHLLEKSVQDQLKATSFYSRYSSLQLSFGSANFYDRRDTEDGLQAPIRLTPPEIAIRFISRLITFIPRSVYGLMRLAFLGKHPEITELHVNITRFYPLSGTIKRVEEILHGTSYSPNPETGFGTGSHKSSGYSGEAGSDKEPQEPTGEVVIAPLETGFGTGAHGSPSNEGEGSGPINGAAASGSESDAEEENVVFIPESVSAAVNPEVESTQSDLRGEEEARNRNLSNESSGSETGQTDPTKPEADDPEGRSKDS